MRYRSITLNDNKAFIKYSLIKYTEEYQTQLEEIKEMNKELADSVENCPKIYSELSDHQSYMIFRGNSCVGAINIGTSTNEKDLEIKVQFMEEKFKNEECIITVLEQLIDTLKLYCFDKENIEIRLLNNIDLEKVNKYQYKKNRLFENVTTYTTSNKHNNRLFPALLNEIAKTEQNLTNWEQCWEKKLDMCGYNDCQSIIDDQIVEECVNGTIPLNEIFYKAETISWSNINSLKSTRNIAFFQNGQIQFNKIQKGPGKNNYEFTYHILKDGFKLERYLTPEETLLQIEENQSYTSIKTPNLYTYYDKEEQEKYVRYCISSKYQSSLVLEIYKNKDNEIEKCYVDFRTHRKNGRVNGLYALRIFSKYGTRRYNLCFTSRKGDHSYDFINEVTSDDEVLFSKMYEGTITLDLIEEMIAKIIPIINRKAYRVNRPLIALELASVIGDYKRESEAAIDFLKQIRGEILLPHLEENIDKFIEEYSLGENYTRKRIIDKEKQ